MSTHGRGRPQWVLAETIPPETSCPWKCREKGGCTEQTVLVPSIQKLGFYGNLPATCIVHKGSVFTKHFLDMRA